MALAISTEDRKAKDKQKRLSYVIFGVFNLVAVFGVTSLVLCWDKPQSFYYCSVLLLLPVMLWLWSVISWSASQYFAYGKYALENSAK